MNPFGYLKTVPTYYVSKPKILYFFGALEVLIATLAIFSLLQTVSGLPGLFSPLNLFSLLGALFLLLGAGFFIAAQAFGWVLIFTGHLCFVLQLTTHFLMRISVENFSSYKTVSYITLHICFLRFLFYPFIYRLFSYGKNRHWVRSSRVPCMIRGDVSFLGRVSEAVLVNISETGCLIECEEELPIEEVVTFSPAEKEIMSLEISVQRRFNENRENLTSQYGGQFVKKIKSAHLRRLLSGQTPGT